MIGKAVADLYDDLTRFESRWRRGAYPVHKRLNFPGQPGRDVYDLVAERANLPPGSDILDAGCGVGFGSIRLAQLLDCRVLSISLSNEELAIARRNALRVGIEKQISFERMSFDEVRGERFDCVVAVESLKHSDDISRSVDSLMSCLRPGGSLLIVDDFYSGSDATPEARRLVSSWRLNRLLRLDDLKDASHSVSTEPEDLTPYVPGSSRLKIALRRAALVPARIMPLNRSVATIFEGGLHLESLYRRGEMSYLMLRLDKESSQ